VPSLHRLTEVIWVKILQTMVPIVTNDSGGTIYYEVFRMVAKSHTKWANFLGPILPGGCPPALGAIKRTVGFKGEAQGYQALGTEFRGWTPGVAPIGSRMKNRLRFRPPSVKGVGQRASELSAWIE
jgi:hypothetical protein